MKVALCTSDFYLPIQESLRQSGHEVAGVFTSCPVDSKYCLETQSFAAEMRAKFSGDPITIADIRQLEERGVDLLISAAYDHKIPTPEDSSIKFLNTHGSLLPEGRGPWPQPWIIMKHPESAGITFHSMTQRWDYGDIVLQRVIKLSEQDDADSLTAKTMVAAKELSDELFFNFDELWNNRTPMKGAGSYWKAPTEEDRTLNLSSDVRTIERLYRAFLSLTLFEDIDTGSVRQVEKLVAWSGSHSYAPGAIVARNISSSVYAVKDGFVSLRFLSVNG